jgi:hypothetical protein
MKVYVIEIWSVYNDPVLFTASTHEKAVEIAEKVLGPFPIEVEESQMGYEITETTLDESFDILE